MEFEPYLFDPDPAGASTLPASWYREPAVLAAERERIFARSWQLVGRTDQVARAGEYFTCTVGDEPIVVTRDAHGELRAFSNVCRHRAGPVARGCGRRTSLTCGYHGWTYRLDGQLLTAPEFDGVKEFEKSSVCLPPARVAAWGPLVFVNLDATSPALSEWLGAIPEETARLGIERMTFHKRIDYEIECNWKVYVDNYLEGYHIPVVHPGLFKQIDYRDYRVDTFRFYSRQDAPIRSAGDSLYRRNLAEGEAAAAWYYWLFPNLMLNLYPDNLQTNVIVPLGPERTRTIFQWYYHDRPDVARDFEQSFAFSDEVQEEDIAICEAVQRGLRSRSYGSGRYSVKRENGVHHFHGLVSEFLKPSP